ncbi:MAG TPA: SIR2 family protein [Polyangium sp.]|nr:SIR2 family protein [Polyangium sp.]
MTQDSMDEPVYHTVRITVYRAGESYDVHVVWENLHDAAHGRSERGPASFDLKALEDIQTNYDKYGELLAKQLFASERVVEFFRTADLATRAKGDYLRLLLCIEDTASELQWLRWELLRHPITNERVATTQKVLFSRIPKSPNVEPVKRTARTKLSVLVAISAPPAEQLQRDGLAPVNFAAEQARVAAALEGVDRAEVRTLGQSAKPFTIDRLITELHLGVDVLYVVCHGIFGKARSTGLILQKEDGSAVAVPGIELVNRLAELQKVPRLVVLASCQSAGGGQQIRPQVNGSKLETSAEATLATLLGEKGVPAIVAMQGNISMETVAQMMPVFFKDLLTHGQIDLALARARGAAPKEARDAWMPALFMRLKDGRLWDFSKKKSPEVQPNEYERVLDKVVGWIEDRKIVPILGPGLLARVHGDVRQTARQLAQDHAFPLAQHDCTDLPRVLQYLSVKDSRDDLVRFYRGQIIRDLIEQHKGWLPEDARKKKDLNELLELVGDKLRDDGHVDPYSILAELPAAVYVTTNFDSLLENALRARKKTPREVLSRWRYQEDKLAAPDKSGKEATLDEPLVYHPFGTFAGVPEGWVLTEDNYFDYLIKMSAKEAIPDRVASVLLRYPLLFLGFRLTDWEFRVLFRLMMSYPDAQKRLTRNRHVAIQLDPDAQTMVDVEKSKAYLAKYCNESAQIKA